MKRWGLLGAAVFAAIALAPSHASAADSEQGPIVLQAGLGISYWDFPNLGAFFGTTLSYAWTGFEPSLEFGYHFSGRHDGLMLGVRQAFMITQVQGHAAGQTDLRVGYDLAFKAGSLEINVDPFAMVGGGYIFDGPHAGIQVTGGLDVKLFFTKGIYAFVRPGELGFQCLHDFGDCAFTYQAAAGAGYAFGQ